MVGLTTNVMISNKPYFAAFNCLKAQLLIGEIEAWKERHKFDQPMVPSGNMLFFVSNENTPLFINKQSVENVVLDSSLKDDCRVLSFLLHQALKIKLKTEELFQWKNFYTSPKNIATVNGKLGRQYHVFMGIIPRVFFEKGYGMIVFEPTSKVFSKFDNSRDANQFNETVGFCMCENCGEAGICESLKFQVGRVVKIDKGRVTMFNIEGKKFDCPSSRVFVETREKATSGEYSGIIRQTAISTKEEHDFVHNFVGSFSDDRLKLNLGIEAEFSWLVLR